MEKEFDKVVYFVGEEKIQLMACCFFRNPTKNKKKSLVRVLGRDPSQSLRTLTTACYFYGTTATAGNNENPHIRPSDKNTGRNNWYFKEIKLLPLYI